MKHSLDPGHHAAAADRSSEERHQFVVFALSGQNYCIDIMSVREIRVVQAITTLPGAAEFVRGIINLRGTIVPVFDLRKRFGLGETNIAENQALVIAAIEGHLTGLLVDEVLDIMASPASAVTPIPTPDTNRRSPFFKSLISQGDEMLIVIDLQQLVQAGCNPEGELAPPIGSAAAA